MPQRLPALSAAFNAAATSGDHRHLVSRAAQRWDICGHKAGKQTGLRWEIVMRHSLTTEEFEALLRKLAPDRDEAGVKYEQLRRRLVTVFAYRGCANPEDLADETMDRVARRLVEVPLSTQITDPSPFIFGVAWNVARESIRRQRTVALPDGWDAADRSSPDDPEEADPDEQYCFELSLRRLPEEDRTLVLQYYDETRRARITRRATLARQLAISRNALRLRIHRITLRLRELVFRCVDTRRARAPHTSIANGYL